MTSKTTIFYTGKGDKGTTRLFNSEKVSKADPLIQIIGKLSLLQRHIGLIITKIPNFSIRQIIIAILPLSLCLLTFVIGVTDYYNTRKINEYYVLIYLVSFVLALMNYPQKFSLGTCANCGPKNKYGEVLVNHHPPMCCTVREIETTLEGIIYDLYKIMAEIATPENQSAYYDTSENIKKLENFIDIMGESIPKITGFISPVGTELSCVVGIANDECRICESFIQELIEKNNMDFTKYQHIIAYLNRLSSFLYTLEQFIKTANETPLIYIKNTKTQD